MIDKSFYDADYYEYGLESGKGIYSLYRWMPELTIPLAMTIIDYLGIKRNEPVLDFGAAKGFLVKAFRWLHREAYGYDVSEYAISNADPEIKDFVSTWIPDMNFKYCIAKDVFEHIEEETLCDILKNKINANTTFVVVPFGKNGVYEAHINNFDKSHIICESKDWWTKFFHNCGWHVEQFTYRVDGIKDKYYGKYPYSHGFFTLWNQVK